MDWQTDFGKKVSLYVDQCRLSAKYEGETASGEMIKPFRREANRSWRFPQFYRSVARPIEGIDATLPVSMVAGARDTRRSTQYDSEFGITYDVESAFLELRRKHALELQNFVIAHHKECIEKVSAELVLPKQVCTLHYQLDMLLARHPGAYDLHSTQRFRDQAESFVELVHRDEMAKAQRKLEKETIPTSTLTTAVRIVCLITLVLAISTMSHELLTRLFAVLFALGCGMALLWEELVVCSLHLLLGETVKRLRLLGAMPQHLSAPTLSIVW